MSQITARPPDMSSLKRSGSLITALVVIVIAGLVVIATRSEAASASTYKPAGVLSFTQAQKEGKVGSIDWGSRCNVATGKLK